MSSNTGYVMTLANSIIGVGILAMPFCFHKCGIILSIILLIISNLVTRLACYYLMKTSTKARRRNLEFIASYVFGPSGKLMAELCVIGYLMGTCITYFVVVGDLGPQIIAKLFDINHSDSLRTIIMVIVTFLCIIPLCLLRNIESLSAICISSILFYFCLVLKIFFESESKIVSTYWYKNVYWWRPSGVTQCLPIFSMALSCQMQIFEIYESLPTQTIDKMNYIVKHGTGICTIVYICVGFFGYVAFNDQQFSGNVLLNLTPSLASDIIQMGFVLSVAVSFPLVVFPCRASLYSLLYHRVSESELDTDDASKHLDAEYTMSFLQPLLQSHADTARYIPEHRFKYITISMVVVALIVGIFIPSIELIIGLVGSTIGVAICIMFPASCFIKINKKHSPERLAAQFLVVFGFIVMILGTYANLGAIDESQSSANIPIDRLPDIHVTQPIEKSNILMSSSKIIEPPPKVDITLENPSLKFKTIKRKPSRLQQNQDESVREINLDEKNKIEIPSVPVTNIKSKTIQSSENVFKSAPIINDVIKSADQSKLNVDSKIGEQISMKKLSDSLINNDAIQKEEQEIAIDDIERQQNDVKRTEEMLAAVKNQLSKQNEENQQILLQKVNEISEKVNQIFAQKDERPSPNEQAIPVLNPILSVNSNPSPANNLKTDTQLKKTIELNNDSLLTNNDTDEKNQSQSIQNDNETKNLPVPSKLNVLSNRANDLKLETLPTLNQIISSKIKKSKILGQLNESIEDLPPKIENTNEIIGRDLLSNDQEEIQSPSNDNIKSSLIDKKTEN